MRRHRRCFDATFHQPWYDRLLHRNYVSFRILQNGGERASCLAERSNEKPVNESPKSVEDASKTGSKGVTGGARQMAPGAR